MAPLAEKAEHMHGGLVKLMVNAVICEGEPFMNWKWVNPSDRFDFEAVVV